MTDPTPRETAAVAEIRIAELERRRAAVLSLADRWSSATELLMPPVVAERLREAVGFPSAAVPQRETTADELAEAEGGSPLDQAFRLLAANGYRGVSERIYKEELSKLYERGRERDAARAELERLHPRSQPVVDGMERELERLRGIERLALAWREQWKTGSDNAAAIALADALGPRQVGRGRPPHVVEAIGRALLGQDNR